jgi:folylpolyglutamate synthase/dihydrofolate synthase
MKSTTKQTGLSPLVSPGKQRSYNEIIELLDANWTPRTKEASVNCMKQLDQAFDYPSQKIKTVLVAGTNGKSLTIHFTIKLLRQEGLSVGAFYSPHILTYNERLSLNNDAILNKTFTEIANDVINMAEMMDLTPNSYEILTMMAFLFFKQNNVDIALIEADEDAMHHATAICSPKIIAVTRATPDNTAIMDQVIQGMLSTTKAGTIVISGDQSKLNLQIMLTITQEKGGVWAMPIRKLAPLEYPFEQLHGRCAALAERISQTFVNDILKLESTIVSGGILSRPKGQRGRPTLEAKKLATLHPQETTEQFWKREPSTLPARFQFLDKEKPSILLDNAYNLDAFENLLLGIRLLHYQRPLKGLTIILGCNNEQMDIGEFLKQLRYFFKKTSGQIIVCPVERMPGLKNGSSWDVEKISNDIKSMKIKARSSSNFKEAFESACKSVDERHGLVVIAGSSSIVAEYWRYKGMKKL